MRNGMARVGAIHQRDQVIEACCDRSSEVGDVELDVVSEYLPESGPIAVVHDRPVAKCQLQQIQAIGDGCVGHGHTKRQPAPSSRAASVASSSSCAAVAPSSPGGIHQTAR